MKSGDNASKIKGEVLVDQHIAEARKPGELRDEFVREHAEVGEVSHCFRVVLEAETMSRADRATDVDHELHNRQEREKNIIAQAQVALQALGSRHPFADRVGMVEIRP